MLPEPGIKLIKRWEGLRLVPYLCPAGILTVGYGHTGKDITGPISKDRANELLVEDCAEHFFHLIKLSPCIAFESENRQGALLSFIYNLGPSNYAASTLRRRINAGLWEDVPTQLMRWCYAKGQLLKGLQARRKAEADLTKE